MIDNATQLQRMVGEKITKIKSIRDIEPLIKELDKAKSGFAELARKINDATPHFSIEPYLNSFILGTIKLPDSWPEQIRRYYGLSFEPSIEQVLLGIQSQLARVSEISLLAEKTLLSVRPENFGSLISVSSAMKNIGYEHNLAFTRSYNLLNKSLVEKELSFLSLPLEVTLLPPVEYFYNSRLLEAISASRELNETGVSLNLVLAKGARDELPYLLDSIALNLTDIWNGVKETPLTLNPAAFRHLSVSLRELLTVLNRIAPDEDIRNWSSLPEHCHNGKPTRRARLLYICRNINYSPFGDFIDKDNAAYLSLIDLLEKGTHSITCPFSLQQMEALMVRTESAIGFLIKTWQESKGN
ncbi:MAG: hypothetical protein PHU81_00035 [Acidobacteriota bacterium]|nr:hypothetical protein [Acidobacteriota bacterium]